MESYARYDFICLQILNEMDQKVHAQQENGNKNTWLVLHIKGD